jgi:hypothetical protein
MRIWKKHIAYNTFSGCGSNFFFSNVFSHHQLPINTFIIKELQLPSIWHIYTILWRKAQSEESTLNVSWVWHIFIIEDFFSFHDVETHYINFKYLLQNYKHLSMKKGSSFILFCFVYIYEIHWTGLLQIAFLVSLEEECISLVSWCLDL